MIFTKERTGMHRILKVRMILTAALAASWMAFPSLAAPLPGALPPAADQTAAQAARTAERNRELQNYYKYSRYQDVREKGDALTVQEEKPAVEEGELSFEVKEIRLTRSELLTADEIRKAVHFKGPGPMTVAELQAIVTRLNALYQEKGIATAQAVLPPQKVENGVVYIRLMEGRYGDTVVEGNERIFTDSILSRVRLRKGELVDLDSLQDQLRVYNSTNTYQLRAELIPGKTQGTSDVHLTLDEAENPITSFIFTDNAGQKESGRYRIGAYTEYRGIGGVDASLAVSPVWTEGIWGGSVIYDTPIGTRGTRMTAAYSRNLVDIIDGAFKDFDMKSNSNDASLSLTHPLNITELSKTDIFLEGHRKWSDTTYAGMDLSDTEARTVKLGLSSRSFDENGLWFAMASVTGYEGTDNLNHDDNNGSYYSAYLMRRQNLPGARYLLYRAYGQFTEFQELPSTEQFTLGGMASVRGFKESILSGDKGWFAGMEYGFPLSGDQTTWRGFIFLDHGVAYNNFSVATTKDFLTSTGLGIEYGKGGWYGKVILGIPLNHSDGIEDAAPRVHFYVQRNI